MLLVRPEALKLAPKLPKPAPAVPVTVRRKVPTAELEQVGDTHQAIDMGPGPALLISNIVVAPCVTLKSKGPMLDSEPLLITRGAPVVVKT